MLLLPGHHALPEERLVIGAPPGREPQSNQDEETRSLQLAPGQARVHFHELIAMAARRRRDSSVDFSDAGSASCGFLGERSVRGVHSLHPAEARDHHQVQRLGTLDLPIGPEPEHRAVRFVERTRLVPKDLDRLRGLSGKESERDDLAHLGGALEREEAEKQEAHSVPAR
jgi:hypothetical protein